MGFISSPFPVFLLFFVGVTVFWLLPWKHKDLATILVFLIVLGIIDAYATTIMFALSIFTFVSCKKIERPRKLAFFIGIVIISSFLLITKYIPTNCTIFDCTASNTQTLIPFGISYLTFRLLHYYIDMGKQRLPEHRFSEFMLYCFFLPIYTAGPLQRFDKFLTGRKLYISKADIIYGTGRMIIGFIKAFSIPYIVLFLLGYSSHQAALNLMFESSSELSTIQTWGWLIFFTLYFYLNLAGYADIAIGAGRLFGFKISENFANPFLAQDMAQFWQRWHMTLGDWFKRYVFFPVAKKTNSFAIGLLASFILIGIWHSGTINWMVWGLFQGICVYLSHKLAPLEPLKFLPKIPRQIAGSIIVFLLFSFSMSLVIIPADYDISHNIEFILKLFGLG